MRELIELGKMVGPRMFVAGRGIGGRPRPPGPVEMRRLVEERIKAGNDWVKLFASTGGFEDVTGTQTLSYEEMEAAVERTHALGARIAIHTYGPAGFRDAVRAGPDSIEHGADVDDETLREMARKKIWFVPTIDHNRYYIDAKDEYHFAPGSEVALRDYIQRNLDTARRAHQAGVRFAMGSDAVYSMFGQNTHELEWLVKAGLTPAQALEAATVNGAELLGNETLLGKVQAGYAADLVAVEGEPWNQIQSVIHGVRWVMKDGAVVVDKRNVGQASWPVLSRHELKLAQHTPACPTSKAESVRCGTMVTATRHDGNSRDFGFLSRQRSRIIGRRADCRCGPGGALHSQEARSRVPQ